MSVTASTSRVPKDAWIRREHLLLGVFLLSKMFLFISSLGKSIGFDAESHINVVKAISWTYPFVNMHTFFYGYHPPLSFLLAHSIAELGFSPVVSIQLLNFVCSLIIFFCWRNLLKHLQLLSTPGPVFFLYTVNTVPLMVFLSRSVNIDVVVLMWGTLAFSESVKLALSKNGYAGPIIKLSAFLCASLLTKYSGILFLPLPALVVWVVSSNKRHFFTAILVALLGMGMASPFYVMRYIIPEGTFFSSNEKMFKSRDLSRAVKFRDDHGADFSRALFLGISVPNKYQPTLKETWQDYWKLNKLLARKYPAHEPVTTLSNIYVWVMPFLLAGGVWIMGLHSKRLVLWKKMGMAMLTLAVIQLLFLILYAYKSPMGHPTKAIYISPTLWSIAFLLSELVFISEVKFLKSLMTQSFVRYWEQVCFGFMVIFIVLNHLLPVY